MKIVAEVGLQHCGCFGTALAYVDACANAGADAVKFQCHDFDPVDKFRPGVNYPQDRTREGYWQRTAFTIDQWRQLSNRCHERGIEFGLSVFSPLAVQQFTELNEPFLPDFWKLGSGVSHSKEMREAIKNSGQRKTVISFGMSSDLAIQSQVFAAVIANLEVTVLQCTSEYPCPPEHVGMNCVTSLQRDFYWTPNNFECAIGLSDHSGTIWPSIIAAWMGADMTEVHVCWSKEQFGPDVPASITIDELRQLVSGVRFVEKMRDNPVDKDKMASELTQMREIFCGNSEKN